MREVSYVLRKNYVFLFSEGYVQPIKYKAANFIFWCVVFCFEMGISLGEGVTWEFFSISDNWTSGSGKKTNVVSEWYFRIEFKISLKFYLFFSFSLYVLRVTFHALTTFLNSLSCLTLKSTTDQFIWLGKISNEPTMSLTLFWK